MHVLTRLDTGGMENGVVNICNGIDRSTFQPVICCLKGTGAMAERLRGDVRVIDLQYAEGKDFFRSLKLLQFFLGEKPDIVHTHGWGGGSFSTIMAARLAGVPVVINGEHGSFFLKPYQIYLQRLLAVICDANLSVSNTLRLRIEDQLAISKNRVQVIHNGVDLKKFNRQVDHKKLVSDIATASGIKIEQTDFVLGIIGSLKPEKNQMMALKALRSLNKIMKDNSIKLLLIGDGKDRKKLVEFVRQNSLERQVGFLGLRDDVSTLLSVIDVLLSTSISVHEGLSNVILEAMASSVATISTESIGVLELIRDGDNGIVINPQDEKMLADKILLLKENRPLRKHLAENGREMVEKDFSLEKMINGYEQVYRKQISKKSKWLWPFSS